jgi:hypothetical protein
MKSSTPIFALILAGLCGAVFPANAQVNVTQYHNNSSRDGLYIDSAFTQSAAANLIRDLNFDGTIVGNVLAQPLYIEGGPGGQAMVIVATTANNVYALNAANGTIIWQRTRVLRCRQTKSTAMRLVTQGSPARLVVNLASRTLLNALTTLMAA